jgi:uncharacterized protein
MKYFRVYFRVYPWILQVFLFGMLVIIMGWFSYSMVEIFLPKFTSYKLTRLIAINEQSPASMINAAVIMQGILSAFIFLIPALLFSYWTTPRPAQYLGLRAPGKKIHLLLAVLIILGAMPILQMIEGLISMINFGPKIKADQEVSESMMKAFLNLPTFSSFVKAFIVLAIIPAAGEELFFRGILLRFVRKRSPTMVMPVIFTAVVFSLSHTNIYGYVSIFLAGVLLAVIYYLTRSIWCSILAHLFFNGTQIILAYWSNTNAAAKAFLENNSVPVYYVVGGAVVFGVSFYLLLKNKTPLPDNWTDDFTAAELSRNVD